jgi:four helix bundle protein
MSSDVLKSRTKRFALSIIELSGMLPNNRVGWTFTNQIVRSATSIAANYRAVCRAKSDKDFIAKMETVIEEADETKFWLEMIDESNVLSDKVEEIRRLDNEANELVSIFVSSVKTVKKRLESGSGKS